MVMKKLMMLLFTGAALIGLGTGVTALELRQWKISEIRTDLLDRPVHTAKYERTVKPEEVERLEIESKYEYGYFGDYQPEIEIITDKNQTGQILVEIEYRGHPPQVYQNVSWIDEKKVIHELWIDINNYNDFVSVYDMIKSMFDNKIYYINGECTYIEKITVYTAYPDKVKI